MNPKSQAARLPFLPTPALAFIIWLFIMTFLPFFIIAVMSFLERSPQGTILFQFSLKSYLRAFDWLYLKVLTRTVVMAGLATLSCLLIGFPVAYHLARSQGALKRWGIVLLFIPFWTNFILRVYGMISLLGNQGLLNQLLLSWGIIDEPLTILYTRTGVFLGLLYNYLPFLVVPIYSALEKLDPTLREAAFDLGANRFQTFLMVTFPNIKEAVFVGSLFVFIPMMGEYVIPDLLGGAKETFLGKIMVEQFFTMQDWPFGSALASLLCFLLLITLYFQSKFKRTADAA